MSKIKIIENKLAVKEGIFKKDLYPMDSLRLIYLFLPESVKNWFLVASSSGIESYDLDSVSSENIENLTRTFDDMIRRESAFKLSGIKLCICDYHNRGTIIPFKHLKASKIDIFDHLLKYRRERAIRREEWLKINPHIVMRGVLGQQAVVDADGFRRGKKSIAWKDVGEIQVNTVNLNTQLLVIPKGVSSGFFSMKKYKYFLTVPQKKKELFIAECNFWMSLVEETESGSPDRRQGQAADQKEEQPWN